MSKSKSRKVAYVLVWICFFMPILGTGLGIIIDIITQGDYDSSRYQAAGLQPVLMGFYNLPLWGAALIALKLSDGYYEKGKEKAGSALLDISIFVSLASIIIMTLWGMGSL